MKLLVRLRWIFLLVAAIAIAAFLAISAIGKRSAPHPPDELIPLVWRTARETPMHRMHVGTKKLVCTECHDKPIEQRDAGAGLGPATEAACNKCHERQTHVGHPRPKADGGASGAPTCLSCHVFGADKPAAQCRDCHTAGKLAAGAPDLGHHASGDIACKSCHTMHTEPRAVLPDCTSCHTTVGAAHGRFAVAAHGADAGAAPPDAGSSPIGLACTACHAPHQGKEAARAGCEACHVRGRTTDAPRVVPGGPRVAGHEACTTCHAPHDARRQDVRACTGCHADRASAVSADAHKSCTGCHDPHRPNAAPAESCVRCHETTKPSHPSAPGGTCVGCHAPHGDRGAKASLHAQAHGGPKAAACTSCHARAEHRPRAGAKHDLACTNCHKPHAFDLKGRGSQLCGQCHEAKVTAVSTRPGHTDCRGCHGAPHEPVAKPTCNGCHTSEHATAPAGHKDCTNCHDAHSGHLTGKIATAASCTGCHENKAKAQHAPVAGGCQTCHRPHGPKGVAQPPACATCHARPSLQGLHATGGHATCSNCHGSHTPPKSDRATCTSHCHTDRRAHQPDAKVCNGCHMFRQ